MRTDEALNHIKKQVRRYLSEMKIDTEIDAALHERQATLEHIIKLGKAAEADAKKAHAIYWPILLRMNVATEVAYLARQVENREVGRAWAMTLLQCFEAPDAWWREREHWPLATWLRELSMLIHNHGDNVRMAWASYETDSRASHDPTSV